MTDDRRSALQSDQRHTGTRARPDSIPGQVSGAPPGAPANSAPATGASSTLPSTPPPGLLSEAECRALVARLSRYSAGGGYTAAVIWSAWSGNVRWARNQITTSGEVRQTFLWVTRDLKGATTGRVFLNETSDVGLVAGARRAERMAQMAPQVEVWELLDKYLLEPMEAPPMAQLYSARTAELGAAERADAAIALAKQAAAAGVLSAGYINVGAHSLAMIDTAGHVRYVPYTTATYTVTVRDPQGQGSGWAGVDWPDWDKIDGPKLTQVAMDKCLESRNPVAVEPGRYTTILEPQAVCDIVGQLFYGKDFAESLQKENNRGRGLFGQAGTGNDALGRIRFGEQVIDARLTISADPLDPTLSFPPFAPSSAMFWSSGGKSFYDDWVGQKVFHPATWIKEGVLTALPYERDSGMSSGDLWGRGHGMSNSGAFQIGVTGPTTSVADMIATTERGLLVTRFDRLQTIDPQSTLLRGYTRDGLWLIEKGKISKPIKNMMFMESVMSVLNSIEQVGVPERTFHPQAGYLAIPQPVIVPPMKVKDFTFTALTSAI